jgi:LPS-assembly protein
MQEPPGETVSIDADLQHASGDMMQLEGNVEIHYRNWIIRADRIDYDQATGDLTATGHLSITCGEANEHITASHGTLNLKQQTGRFYDVQGTATLTEAHPAANVYVNENPVTFTGRLVVKTGPEHYDIYDGSLTTCELPNPDWLFSSQHFSVDAEQVRAHNTTFRLLHVPVLYLPYVTHPVDPEQRQSGFLIPVLGQSSSKGLIVGEQVYWAINRSTDLLFGAQYYSKRGWEQSAKFQHRGVGQNFLEVRYSGLLDRGYTPPGGTYLNQGGEDLLVNGRRDFAGNTRIVASVEYLSSYAYREAFSQNFNTAVSTDIFSSMYLVHSWRDLSVGVAFERYQGLKRIATPAIGAIPAQSAQEIRIFHAPEIDLSATDHALGHTGLVWSFDSSFAALKRVQPNFATGGLVQRIDLHPQLSYPRSADGWYILPSIALRETAYNRSRNPPLPPGQAPSQTTVENTTALSRSNLELGFTLRPPVLERTFTGGWLEHMVGRELKHTIEPSFDYRYVTGIHNFQNVLRFDERDIASNTNEIQYGVTQRLYLRPGPDKPCPENELGGLGLDDAVSAADAMSQDSESGVTLRPPAAPAASTTAATADQPNARCGAREVVSWRLTQKTFFNQNFSGAVQNGRRNVLDTTLSLSGIAFLTEPRAISPVISRLRVRTSDRTDVEWDFDYDTGASKLTSSNVLLDSHVGQVFGALSYARLNAPGRFYVESPSGNLTSSNISNFSQMRVLLGYGVPTRPGLSMAGNAGLDLNTGTVQYGALQANYNWNCCGLSVEYRKYELGQQGAVIRNENVYRFNFTLVNIGTAGNLRRTERLF